LIFLRHGQYDEAALTREGGALTPLGRKQAAHTAVALRKLPVSVVWSSTLLRAKETATIVASKQQRARVKRSALLCEVIPTKLPRHLKLRIPVDAKHVEGDRKRADRAFTKLFKEARAERTEIVVCHGNLIRYLVCRALGIHPKLWMRLDSTHCGLTEFRVLPGGVVRVVRYNDVGHIPQSMRTVSATPPRASAAGAQK
jgi:serine/threonine-protein phosphatase PGAM5